MDFFEKNMLSFSSLKSVSGGFAAYTSNGGSYTDFIDNKSNTHWNDCRPSTDDSICTAYN